MSDAAAYSIITAFVALQLVPLTLAFRGKPGLWFIFQLVFGVSFFVLAELQYSGRAGWLLMMITAITLAVTSAASFILAVLGRYFRSRTARSIQKGIA